MRITQYGALYQVTFFPILFPVNCYLIEEHNSLTLIDTGIPSSTKGILKAAEKMGKPITKILLTHAHDDHVGALDELKKILPSSTVFISRRDSRLLSGDRSLETNEPNMPIKGGVPKKINTKADVLIQDGDKIDSLLCISVPGHTPGSMAFLDTRNNALIVGDAFQVRGGIAVAGQLRHLFPFPAFATWNKELAINSASKLCRFNPTLLATGHGVVIENPSFVMDKAIKQANKNLDISHEKQNRSE